MGGPTPPQHGQYSGYTTLGCRLECCRSAATRYNKRYKLRSINGPTKVSTTGAIRRLRALATMGWSLQDVATEMGVELGSSVGGLSQRETITRTVHDRIAAAYDRLHTKPGPSPRSRRYAQREGWAPPLAWDDDTIDDPNAKPNLGEAARGLDLDEWWFLVQGGEYAERAALRCGVTIDAVERAAHRAGRKELAMAAARARNAKREWKAVS